MRMRGAGADAQLGRAEKAAIVLLWHPAPFILPQYKESTSFISVCVCVCVCDKLKVYVETRPGINKYNTNPDHYSTGD